MDYDSKVRKCSSCKLALPSHLFKSEQSSFFYKTCLPCRYKKRLKYYCGASPSVSRIATLSNVPLSKREKSDKSIDQGEKKVISALISSNNPNLPNQPPQPFGNCISEDLLVLIPQAKWLSCVSEQSDHMFIASAVLTPLSLDRYTGSSRKYSVIN